MHISDYYFPSVCAVWSFIFSALNFPHSVDEARHFSVALRFLRGFLRKFATFQQKNRKLARRIENFLCCRHKKSRAIFFSHHENQEISLNHHKNQDNSSVCHTEFSLHDFPSQNGAKKSRNSHQIGTKWYNRSHVRSPATIHWLVTDEIPFDRLYIRRTCLSYTNTHTRTLTICIFTHVVPVAHHSQSPFTLLALLGFLSRSLPLSSALFRSLPGSHTAPFCPDHCRYIFIGHRTEAHKSFFPILKPSHSMSGTLGAVYDADERDRVNRMWDSHQLHNPFV